MAAATVTQPWPTADVVVVGAGISGLSAARALVEAKQQVVVLEARDRVGGRIWTDRSWGSGYNLDLGASWVHGSSKAHPVTKEATAANAALVVTNWESATFYWQNGKEVSDKDLEKAEASFETATEAAAAAAKARQRTKQPDAPLSSALDQWSKSIGATATQSKLFDFMQAAEIEQEFGADVKDLSLFFWENDSEIEGEEKIFPLGYDQITKRMQTTIANSGKGQVLTSSPVTKIDYKSPGRVQVTTANGGTVVCKRVLVTVPLGVLKRGAIEFVPPLPASKTTAISSLGFGVLGKIYLRFPKRFWDNTMIINYVSDTHGEFSNIVNLEKALKKPVLLLFTAGSFAREMSGLTDSQIADRAMKALQNMYGKDIPKYEAVLVTRWDKDPFTHGAYSYYAVGSTPNHRKDLGRSIGQQVFFAGEATHVKYPSTVHGALLSGEDAATQILGLDK